VQKIGMQLRHNAWQFFAAAAFVFWGHQKGGCEISQMRTTSDWAIRNYIGGYIFHVLGNVKEDNYLRLRIWSFRDV
jgi:hypothetical protein